MTEDISVEGPLLDEETGMRRFTLRQGDHVATFGIAPVENEGVTRWIMHAGPEEAQSTDPGFEPYNTEEEAYEAGLRAGRERLSKF